MNTELINTIFLAGILPFGIIIIIYFYQLYHIFIK
jgi:hypothetical protein